MNKSKSKHIKSKDEEEKEFYLLHAFLKKRKKKKGGGRKGHFSFIIWIRVGSLCHSEGAERKLFSYLDLHIPRVQWRQDNVDFSFTESNFKHETYSPWIFHNIPFCSGNPPKTILLFITFKI